MNNRVIMFRTGYAESCSVGYLIFSTFFLGDEKTFATKFEAFEVLAEDLFQQYKDAVEENNRYVKQRFGDEYDGEALATLNEGDFAQFVTDMSKNTTNDHLEDAPEGYKVTFSPFWADRAVDDISRGDFIFIDDRAEIMFKIALGFKYPEIFNNFFDFELSAFEKLFDRKTYYAVGDAAIKEAEQGAELYVLNPQTGWVKADEGALERAKASEPHARWIYGVRRR